MKTQQTKIKVVAIGNHIDSYGTNGNSRKVILSVIELPNDNPYGKESNNAVPFEIEVHNKNIEEFSISKNLVNEIGLAEIIIQHYRKDVSSPTFNRYLLNKVEWQM